MKFAHFLLSLYVGEYVVKESVALFINGGA